MTKYCKTEHTLLSQLRNYILVFVCNTIGYNYKYCLSLTLSINNTKASSKLFFMTLVNYLSVTEPIRNS